VRATLGDKKIIPEKLMRVLNKFCQANFDKGLNEIRNKEPNVRSSKNFEDNALHKEKLKME